MATLTVGPGRQFATIAEAVSASRDGDTLLVQAGTYRNDFAIIAKDITIQGQGGLARLEATEAPPNGKAILVANGDITLDHVELTGARVPDQNGAGVRLEGGNLVISNAWIHGNENGILAGDIPGATLTLRDTEVSDNGRGDGRTHNVYVGVIDRLTIDDSLIRDADVGHQVKSRALETVITDSRILDGDGGTGSYSVDLPNGGRAVLSGDVIQQSAASQNPAIVHFGGEGSPHPNSSLEITNTTVLNALESPSSRLVLNQTDAPASIHDVAVFGLDQDEIASGRAEIGRVTNLASPPGLDRAPPWAGGGQGNGVDGAQGAGPGGGSPGEPPSVGTGTPGQMPAATGQTLQGTPAADRLAGGDGPDTIDGAGSWDELSGGPSADTFVFGAREERRDTILDFNPAEGDRLDLSGVFAGLPNPADGQGLLDQSFVTLFDRPGGVLVKVDLDGDGAAAGAVPIASLQGLHLSDLTGGVLIG